LAHRRHVARLGPFDRNGNSALSKEEEENDANEMKQTTSKEVQLSSSTIEKEEPTNDCTTIYGTHRPLKCSNKKEGGFSRTHDKTRVLFFK
jgi:hypothetical protein